MAKTRRHRGWSRLAAVGLAAVIASSGHSRAQALDELTLAEVAREFTQYDGNLDSRVIQALEKRRIHVLSERDPASAELIQLAFKWKQFDRAFTALRAAAAASPDRLVAALSAAGQGFNQGLELTGDQSAPARAAFLMALEPIAARVSSLPREDAARVVLALYRLETRLGRPLRNSVTARWADYQDTEFAALQRAYDAIRAVPYNKDRLAALDRLASSTPHSILAAAALQTKAQNLAHNALTLVPNEQDPTERVLAIMAIVSDLESGQYPDSAIDGSLSEVVTGMFISDQLHVAPDNQARLVASYRDFLRSHAGLADADNFCQSSTFYWITRYVATALDPQAPARAVTTLFNEDLRPRVRNPDRLDLCLARFDLAGGGIRTAGQDAQRAQGVDILNRLSASSSTEASRALSTLASKAFSEHDDTRAASLLDAYLERFPNGPWAWVAAMKRAGLSQDKRPTRATAEAYLAVARTYRNQPLAPVLGAYFAGWNFEEAGAMPQALDAYQEANRNWDHDYDEVYDFPISRAGRATPPYQPSAVTFSKLTSLIARLTADLRESGGSDLAHARRLLDDDRFEDATDALRAFLRAHPSSQQAATARKDMHKAQFRRALDLGNVFRKEHDDAACFAILDALEREPYDFYVAAAGLARSSILHRQGHKDEAHRVALATVQRLYAWRTAEIARMRLDPLDAELAAIRNDLLRPGSLIPETGLERATAWQWPKREGLFAQMRPAMDVTIDGKTTERTVWQTYASVPNAIPLDADESESLDWIAFAGNTSPRAFPRAIGQGVDELLSWRDVLGYAGAYIDKVVFLNDTRTLATMSFGWKNYGFSATIEKFDGHWRVVRVSDMQTIYN